MKREKALIKNTVVIAFGTILPKIASFITLPIVTGKLTHSEYGTYDLITTLVALFLPIVTLQIQSAAFRYLIDVDEVEEEKKTIISTIFFFVMSVSAIAIMLLFFILDKLSWVLRGLIATYFFVDIFLIVLQQIARGLHRNKLYSLSAVIVSVSNMILLVASVQIADLGLGGVLFSITGATFISAILVSCKLNLKKYINICWFSKRKLNKLLSYSWPMIPNTLSNWVMGLSDRLIITSVLGLEANAIYSVANKIPNLFTSIQGTFVMAWQENASIASKDEDIDSYYTKMFDSIFRLLFSIMAVLIAVTPVLFWILIKGNYDEAYYQIPILYMALLFSAVASFVGGIYVAKKQTKSIGVTTIVAAIINVAVNIGLIHSMGIYAGAISTLVSYLVLAIFRMKNIKKYVNITYRIKDICLMCMILIGMCVLCYYKNNILNLINCILAVTFSVIYNKKLIVFLISKVCKR